MMPKKANKYKEKSRRYFDKQSTNYFATFDGKFSSMMYKGVVQRIKTQPFISILDIGCGTGTMLSMVIDECKDVKAYGIDFSEKMMEKASALLGSKVQLTVGDSDSLPWPGGSFDLVVCNSAFHHFPEPVKALNEIRRVLIPGGRIIIADPWWPNPLRFFLNLLIATPLNYLGDVRVYSEAEMRALLEGCGYTSISWEIVDKKYSIAAALTKN